MPSSEADNALFRNVTAQRAETSTGERPLYIRDCVEWLGKTRDIEQDQRRTALALDALPALIRRNAVGFEDVAPDLLERVLYLEDRFCLPDFMVLFFFFLLEWWTKYNDIIYHK